MTDVVINEETGLPELPEGHFWEIARVRNWGKPPSYEFIIANFISPIKDWVRQETQTGDMVSLTDYYLLDWADRKTYVRISDDWSVTGWKLTGVTRNYSEAVKEPFGKFWPFNAWEVEVVKLRPEYEVAKAIAVFKSVIVDEDSFDWSDKSIQQVARQTYRNWQKAMDENRKEVAQQQRISTVLGSYPPKSLNVVD